MDGWICLYRKFQEHEFWQEKRVYSKAEAWLSLLMKANHNTHTFILGNQMIKVNPGELITSEIKLAKEWGWGRKKVKNFLTVLKNQKMATTKCTTKYTSVTIENWEKYQNQGTTNDTTNDTSREHQRNIKGTHTTIINNYNNDKQINKKERKKESFDDLINSYTQNEELRQELKNHLATRKAKKATLTNRAIELSFKKLDELAPDDYTKIKIVQQSIERGWTGFFEIKQNKENTLKGNPFLEMLEGGI